MVNAQVFFKSWRKKKLSCTLHIVSGCHWLTLQHCQQLCRIKLSTFNKKMDLNRAFELRYLFLKFFFCNFLICVFHIEQLIMPLVYRLNLLFLPLTWSKNKIKKTENKTAYGFFCNDQEKKKFSPLRKIYPTTKNWYKYLKIFKCYSLLSCTD